MFRALTRSVPVKKNDATFVGVVPDSQSEGRSLVNNKSEQSGSVHPRYGTQQIWVVNFLYYVYGWV